VSGWPRRGSPALAVWLALTAPVGHTGLAATIRVEVKGLTFIPAEPTAHPGDTIEWVNDDFVAHTATALNGAWDVQLPPHATGRAVVKTPGRVAYYCRYHPNMKAAIAVAPN
jgi:plastocyanin